MTQSELAEQLREVEARFARQRAELAKTRARLDEMKKVVPQTKIDHRTKVDPLACQRD
jgi:thermostable 8-oxoguanine DNA glycosylase